jgi:hypothetical protein
MAWMRIALEWAGERVEGMSAVKFGDLSQMAEIVIGEFVEQFGKRHAAGKGAR